MSEHFSNRIWQDIAAELNHPDWRSLKKTYEDARRIITAGEPDVVATLQQRLAAAGARITELEGIIAELEAALRGDKCPSS